MLIVDDSKLARYNYHSLFQDEYEITEAFDGEKALELILNNKIRFDVMLIDMVMPKMTGLELLLELNKYEQYAHIPKIFVSGDEESQIEALKSGAWDFITKDTPNEAIRIRVNNVMQSNRVATFQEEINISNQILSIIISNSNDVIINWSVVEDTLYCTDNFVERFGFDYPKDHVYEAFVSAKIIFEEDIPVFEEEMLALFNGAKSVSFETRMHTAEGVFVWSKWVLTGVMSNDGELVKVVGILNDISSYKEALSVAMNEASHDGLTGLTNKHEFTKNAAHDIKEATGVKILLIIDLDSFKYVNDSYGHSIGDEVLRVVATRISSFFRGVDLVGRIGGDEFAVLIRNDIPDDILFEKLSEFIQDIGKPFTVDEQEIVQRVSVGACKIMPEAEVTFIDAFRMADKALYKSKNSGKNSFTLEYLG